MSRSALGRLARIVVSTLAAGCLPLAPVARDPWVEDRSLELSREQLEIDVARASVDVDAVFYFTPKGSPREHAMDFLVGSSGGPARGFRAELVGENGAVTALRTRSGSAPPFVISGAGESWSFLTPPNAFAARGNRLRVRYSQHPATRFDYVLRTGAYWAGPIGVLDVVIRDPERRIVEASVEGRAPDGRDGNALLWHFVDLEPKQLIELTLASRK